MPHDQLAKTIDDAFDKRDTVTAATAGPVREAVEQALELLDSGTARVAERQADGRWQVNQWLKKAVLLSFRLNDMSIIKGGPGDSVWWDKVPPSSTAGPPTSSRSAGFRAVPNSVVAKIRLHRARCCADAVLRQSRRLCRFRYHGGRLGHRRLLCPDRQELPHFRWRRHRWRAGAAAGGPGYHRGQLFHRCAR